MYRVTLDSNIYISALNFGGAPVRVLGMARAGIVQIDISEAILIETLGVLRDKFDWPGYRLHDARDKLMRMTRFVAPTLCLEGIPDDDDDHRIIECAVTARSEYILTHDTDLLRVREYAGMRDNHGCGISGFESVMGTGAVNRVVIFRGGVTRER